MEFAHTPIAAGELTLSNSAGTREAWELRHGNHLVGLVERSLRRTRVSGGQSGYWSVTRGRLRLGSRLVFRPSVSIGPIVTYQPHLLRRGGRLVLSEQRSFKLRSPGLVGRSWRLVDEEGAEFTRANFSRQGQWLLHLSVEAAREPAAHLIVLATCYVIVADYQTPKGYGGG